MAAEREFDGVVENGRVYLESGIELPEGTRVIIRVVATKPSPRKRSCTGQSKSDRLMSRSEASARRSGSGAQVSRRVAARSNGATKSGISRGDKKKKTATLLDFAGCMKGLPADASLNVDHYLYGAPKRRRKRVSKAR